MTGNAFGFGSPITYPISQPIPFGLSPQWPSALSGNPSTQPQQYGQPLQQIFQILQMVPHQLQQLQQLQYAQQQQLQHVQQLLQAVPAQLAQLQSSGPGQPSPRDTAVGHRFSGLRPVGPRDVNETVVSRPLGVTGEQRT